MEAKKSKKGTIIALAVLAAVLIGCLALYFAMKPAPQAGGKSIVVEVIHGDGTSREFKLSTEAEYLGGALVEGKVVEDNQGRLRALHPHRRRRDRGRGQTGVVVRHQGRRDGYAGR